MQNYTIVDSSLLKEKIVRIYTDPKEIATNGAFINLAGKQFYYEYLMG